MPFVRSAVLGAVTLALSTAAQAAGQHAGGHALPFGEPGNAGAATRTVEIVAKDHEFSLPAIQAKEGETIRLVIRNQGQFLHELALGTPEMHREHQEHMVAMMEAGMLTPTSIDLSKPMPHGGHGSHGMSHDDPNAVLVEPGATKELVWTFRDPQAPLEFACNLPGHYESGMRGDVRFQR